MTMTLLKNSTAPRPERRSFSRSLYDAIESNAGPSTIEQVISLLPATDDADKWNTSTPDRVTQLLKSAESHGYVQYDEASQRWKLATKQWYEQRQAHIAEQRMARDMKPGPLKFVKRPEALTPLGYSSNQMLLAFLGGMSAMIILELAVIGVAALLVTGGG